MIIFGYGRGISYATARRFGQEGYALALVGRNDGRLAEGVAQLEAEALTARAYRSDAADPAMIRRTVAEIREDLGAVSAVLWTAFRSGDVTDILNTCPEDIERVFDVGVAGLLALVQETVGDLGSTNGAVLVANGSVGEDSDRADGFAKQFGIDGVALENAAKDKLVGLLAQRLRNLGVYVGQVMIAGSVAGTSTATPTAIEPSAIAETFWSMCLTRDRTRVRIVEQGFFE